MGAYLLHIYKGSPAHCEKVELETLRSHLDVVAGVCDARILARWRRGDSFCKGGHVKLMVLGKTGIVAIVTAEMKIKPHMLVQ